MKTAKKTLKVIVVIILLMMVIFLAGRYGWSRETGTLPQSEQYGVFVRLEREDVYSVSMNYEGFEQGGVCVGDYEGFGQGGACAGDAPWETGRYIFMDNDIMMAAKDEEKPVYFTITAKREDGAVLAFGEFQFDAEKEKMFLTFKADGRIVEDIL